MRTLLIADDERTIREGIAGSLNWDSLHITRVLLATDGREAYEIINRERPDIVIIDIIMPEMTGFEVISSFRDDDEGPEFIIISGHEDFHYAQEAIRYDVNNYLLKPCSPHEIETTLKQVLSKIEQRQSLEREQLHLKEYVNLLMPQAKEQILRSFLVGGSEQGCDLFKKLFGQCCEAYQLLLFSVEDPEDYGKLLVFKTHLDGATDMLGWSVSTIVRDGVALVFDAQAERELRDLLDQIVDSVTKCELAGIRAVVSAKGTIDSLPESYKETSEVSRRIFYAGGSNSGVGDSIPLIDACTAQYSEPIRKAVKYLKDNLDDSSLSLNYIASNVLYLNPDYLGKLFKKECGVKFSDYLMLLRIGKAKQIIAMSVELKIYEVASRVGLGDSAAYFGQAFRKCTGMLPSEYREKNGRSDISYP